MKFGGIANGSAPITVIPGLVPGTYELWRSTVFMGGRDKPGHDGEMRSCAAAVVPPLNTVIPGLVPGTYELWRSTVFMGGRDKPGHDGAR